MYRMHGSQLEIEALLMFRFQGRRNGYWRKLLNKAPISRLNTVGSKQ